MKNLKYIIYSSVLFCCFSCEDVIDVKLNEGRILLAVDGWIDDQPGPYTISLNQTQGYFDNNEFTPVSGGVLKLIDSDGQVENLTENQPGKYQTSPNFFGQIGKSYRLEILVNGEEYFAETAIQRQVVIDSITYEYKESSGDNDEGYFLNYYGWDPEGIGDNYRLKLYQNGKLLNQPKNLIYETDEWIDGNYIHDLQLNWDDPFAEGDTVMVEGLNITKDAYYFFAELSEQTDNGGMFAVPPSNVRTNIFNKNPKQGLEVVGYFGGSSNYMVKGVITGEKGVIK
ncbi:MAG: DUF4249 domain-containing protein [Flammeovirgaceae bacterium]|nr:DUF4249 domain-containing protein [Flammeovirgaceae bacterium]